MKNLTYILILTILFSCDFKSSEDYNKEAEKLEKEGKYYEAITLLDKALKIDPNNIYALMNRGVDKSLTGDYKGAIEDYSRIIKIDSDNTLAYLNRGKNKGRLEDNNGAIVDYDKAIATKGGEQIYLNWTENEFFETGYEFDVPMEEILYSRGVARYEIDSLKTSFDDFNFCIEKNYELHSSYYWRGLIYLAADMEKEGCDDLKNAHELGNPDAKEIISQYCKY